MRDPQDPSEKSPEVIRMLPSRAEGARALYVINLATSHTPMPLEMPEVRGFFGLAVFRSRRIEEGRDRYCLHLGYFESRADAERALPEVQRRYPTAWIAAAPRSGLGSLDDTNVSEFRLIHSPARAIPTESAGAEAGKQARAIPVAAPQRYVVQLVWSEKRIDPREIPQLAIYDAYTLYTVTLMRGGRRLYGVRLGFFTSVISARQIALYVRPDFASVAVVPVSNREFEVARTIAWHREARTVIGAEAQAMVPPPGQPAAAPPSSATPDQKAPQAARIEPPARPEPAATAKPALSVTSSPAPVAAPDPVKVVSAKLVQSPTPTPTMVAREQSRKRRPAFSRNELLAALGADDLSLPRKQHDPITEPGMTYPGVSSSPGVTAPRRESKLGRLLHRLTNRHR
jgi:hypothetical protein